MIYGVMSRVSTCVLYIFANTAALSLSQSLFVLTHTYAHIQRRVIQNNILLIHGVMFICVYVRVCVFYIIATTGGSLSLHTRMHTYKGVQYRTIHIIHDVMFTCVCTCVCVCVCVCMCVIHYRDDGWLSLSLSLCFNTRIRTHIQ